jgi:hypothetical protein
MGQIATSPVQRVLAVTLLVAFVMAGVTAADRASHPRARLLPTGTRTATMLTEVQNAVR